MTRKKRFIPEYAKQSVDSYGRQTALVEVTFRCIQGRMLLLPSQRATALINGVVGRAQAMLEFDLHGYAVLSNHGHYLISVADAGHLSRIMCFIHTNISKELGRPEHNNWEGPMLEGRGRWKLVMGGKQAEARLEYILANGTKEFLVDTPQRYRGPHCAAALAAGTEIFGEWIDRSALTRLRAKERRRAARGVNCGELASLAAAGREVETAQSAQVAGRDEGEGSGCAAAMAEAGSSGNGYEYLGSRRERQMEEECTLRYLVRLSPLPHLRHLSEGEYREFICRLCEKIAATAAAVRETTGQCVLGMGRMLRLHPHTPVSKPLRVPGPTLLTQDPQLRTQFVEDERSFQISYETGARHLNGYLDAVDFPKGGLPPTWQYSPKAPAARGGKNPLSASQETVQKFVYGQLTDQSRCQAPEPAPTRQRQSRCQAPEHGCTGAKSGARHLNALPNLVQGAPITKALIVGGLARRRAERRQLVILSRRIRAKKHAQLQRRAASPGGGVHPPRCY